ncbi:MAG: hypothetical protein D6766_08160 [Verrucomicrobia bacterium]|nr:MAG: hypothetical protein D6766_08160 [Verrucomicrobiota bacterium]
MRNGPTQPAEAPAPARWRRVAAVLLALKLAYLAGVTVAVVFWSEFEDGRAVQIQRSWFPPGWPTEPRSHITKHWATWDAEHYLYLSAEGYRPEARSIAFYPLWPLILGAATSLVGGHREWVGLVLANLFSLGGWLGFHRAVARRFGESSADLTLALLIAFPGSLFFQFIYSEPLFFLLLAGLWWAIETRRYPAAMICATLLPLTRGVGVFLVLPLGWHAWTAARPEWAARFGRRGRRSAAATESAGPESGASSRPPAWGPWALAGMPALGWGIYLGLMALWTGDPFAGIAAQRYWGVHSISNLWNVPKFLAALVEVREWHSYQGSMLDRLGFVLAAYAVPALWDRARDLLPWWIALALLPAMSGTFTSYIRFESCAFPVFVGWGLMLGQPRRRWLAWVVVAVLAAEHLDLLWRFVNYRWAG